MLVSDFGFEKRPPCSRHGIDVHSLQQSPVQQLRHVETAHDLCGERRVLGLLDGENPQPHQQSADVNRRIACADVGYLFRVVDEAPRLRIVNAIERDFVEEVDGRESSEYPRDVGIVGGVVDETELVGDVVSGDGPCHVPHGHV